MTTSGVAASARTRRRGYTPPQQPQRRRPGTTAKTAGSANMRSWWSARDGADKPADGLASARPPAAGRSVGRSVGAGQQWSAPLLSVLQPLQQSSMAGHLLPVGGPAGN